MRQENNHQWSWENVWLVLRSKGTSSVWESSSNVHSFFILKGMFSAIPINLGDQFVKVSVFKSIQAEQLCQRWGMELPTIGNELENQMIRSAQFINILQIPKKLYNKRNFSRGRQRFRLASTRLWRTHLQVDSREILREIQPLSSGRHPMWISFAICLWLQVGLEHSWSFNRFWLQA